jgi:hypothetical protein
MTTGARYQVVEGCADCTERYFGDCPFAYDNDKINAMPPDCPLLKVADMVPREKVERLREALRLALVELDHAPCRDNPEHTLCLKCRAANMAKDALAALEE